MENELVNEFLLEGFEILDELDQQMLALEQDPDSIDLISSIFRHVHTVKGTCGFLGFSKLEGVTHVGENLLSKVRDGKVEFSPEIATLVLQLVDAMRAMLQSIEATGAEGSEDYSQLRARLEAAVEGRLEITDHESDTNEQSTSTSQIEFQEEFVGANELREARRLITEAIGSGGFESGSVLESLAAIETFIDVCGQVESFQFQLIEEGLRTFLKVGSQHHVRVSPEQVELLEAALAACHEILAAESGAETAGEQDYFALVKSLQDASTDLEKEGEVSTDSPTKQDEVVDASEQASKANEDVGPTPKKGSEATSPKQSTTDRGPSLAESSLRVDVAILDALMNLVGELVLVRNQMLQCSNTSEDSVLISTVQRLNLVTSELQEGVMKTRMQPIANVWNKFPRVVRDLARQCDKKIRLEMVGKETELDKTILEAIKDPLTHMVRNSVDHGIETPEVRQNAGKDEEGVITLRASHEGGQVVIELEDDGKGIDPQKIRDRLIDRRLKTPEELAQLQDADVIKLIFLPGFSTAEKVTNVSGRGVGMDVVKTNIERISGAVDIKSEKGFGSTIILKIPLTLAIIPALLVTSGKQRFAIPQVSLVELLRFEGKDIASELELIQGAMFYRLRGALLPLVSINEVLGLEGELPTLPEIVSARAGKADLSEREMSVVVLRVDERQFGLLVDHINDTEEIVVKALGRQFKQLPVYAGATILGDGRVALILDVLRIAERANLSSVSDLKRDQDEDLDDGNRQSVLLFDVGGKAPMAMPLSSVDRLEKFPIDTIEEVGNRLVTQYRGGILPLIDLPHLFGNELDHGETVPVIVYSQGQHSVGLVVKQIMDVVEVVLTPDHGVIREGVMYSAVVGERVVEFIDTEAIVGAVENDASQSDLVASSKA